MAAAVAANVDNEGIAEGKVAQDFVQIAFADGGVERTAANVTHIAGQHLVLEAGGGAMFVGRAEHHALQRVVEVGGVGFIPLGVAGGVEGRPEIDVPVAQFAAEIAQYLKKGFFRHGIGDLCGIATVHFVPVESVFFVFVVEKAVVLINDFPQGFEVSARGGGEFVGLYAGRERSEQERQRHEEAKEMFHWKRGIEPSANSR